MTRPEVAGPGVVVLYEPVPDNDDGQAIGSAPLYMTLAIAIVAQGGIVLAGDGRVTAPVDGSLWLRTDAKVKVYDFGRFGLAGAGFAGTVGSVMEALRTSPALAAARDVVEAHAIVGDVLRTYMGRFKGFDSTQWPPALLLLTGYDADGIPRVYELDGRKLMDAGVGNWVGNKGGGAIAEACAKLMLGGWDWCPPIATAKLFAVIAIAAAASVDLSIGTGATGLAVVTPSGFMDASGELADLNERAQGIVRSMRGAFERAVTSSGSSRP